eukprot:3603500-Rhodomonas_salina.2
MGLVGVIIAKGGLRDIAVDADMLSNPPSYAQPLVAALPSPVPPVPSPSVVDVQVAVRPPSRFPHSSASLKLSPSRCNTAGRLVPFHTPCGQTLPSPVALHDRRRQRRERVAWDQTLCPPR